MSASTCECDLSLPARDRCGGGFVRCNAGIRAGRHLPAPPDASAVHLSDEQAAFIEPTVRGEVIGFCGKSCGGDLYPLIADGAWSAEKCRKCNGSWWFQVPRKIAEIDAAVDAERKRRAAHDGIDAAPPVLRPCTPDDPCDEHAVFGGAPREVCDRCSGSGDANAAGVYPCPKCNGGGATTAESPESDYARGRREAIEEAARYLKQEARVVGRVGCALTIERHEAEIRARRP